MGQDAPQRRATSAAFTLWAGVWLVLLLGNVYLYTAAGREADPSFLLAVLGVGLAGLCLFIGFQLSGWLLGTLWLGAVGTGIVYAAVRVPAEYASAFGAALLLVSGAAIRAVRRLVVRLERQRADLAHLDTVQQEIQKRLQELTALFEVGQRVAATFDLERLFQDTMAIVARHLRMYRGTLALYDPQAQEVRVKYAYGLRPEEIAHGRYRLGEGIYGTVIATGEPMAVPNLGDEPIFLRRSDPATLERETRSVAILCVPIRMEGTTVGVLSVDRAPVDQRTLGDDLHFLTILASTLAQALKIQQMIEAAVEHERFAVLGRVAQSVAHEVRNPLGGIRGAAQLLQLQLQNLSRELPDRVEVAETLQEAYEYTRIIVQEVDRLNRVVEGLLRARSAETIRRRPCSLVSILEDVLVLIRKEAEQIGVEIIAEFQTQEGCLLADPDALTQVFLNLFQNALEAMPEGGKVHVVVREVADPAGGRDRFEIEVRDTGPGIPPESRSRIFDPLYTTKQKGTGVGLALSKRLVEAHEGYIEVSDNRPRGAVFTVVLPKALPEGDRKGQAVAARK
ncbi:MAG: hypothetical protein KatS3mg115_0457 [Candidatus Poribacteria bacterium]|nr:MAG: hypothetical protein KatS3mg115_0457 [Candidatus Poribacteria bacterium]